jgi:glucose 1-dehydrogenase
MMFDLNGKRALVTGSTQGIGQAVAKCLAAAGAEVYIHGSRSAEKCQLTVDDIIAKGGKAHVCVADLSEPDAAEKIYSQTGGVDILVLNASLQIRKAWNEITPDEFDTQTVINFKSTLRIIQLMEPYMAENGWGRIVTVGSVQQYKPHKDMLVYAATKSAVMSMVQNLAKQLAPKGITVNNMSPGVIATPRNETALSDAEYAKKVIDGIPCGYAGLAEDCAGAVLLLCSEEGRYITGDDLIVDGGMHL